MATGANASVKWGFESTFKTASSNINKIFGNAQEITTLDDDNTLQSRYAIGSRNAQQMKNGKFAGNFSIDFDFIEPYCLELATGGAEYTGTAPDVSCTFSEKDVLPSFTVNVQEQIGDTGATIQRQLLGCMVKNASISFDAASDDPIKMTLDCDFADEVKSAPGSFTAQTFDSQDPMIFANATWSMSADGTAYTEIALTEKVDIKIDQGAELKYALGSRKGARMHFGERKYEISTTNYFDDVATYLEYFWGATGATGPSNTAQKCFPYMKLKLVNSNNATVEFIFSNVYVSKHGNPIKGPSEDIMEEVELVAQGMNIKLDNYPVASPTR